MNARRPVATELDQRFSFPDAEATPWDAGRRALEDAQIYWITTVRHERRPHVTPVIGLLIDDVFFFTTGPSEQKAKNIVDNSNCAVVTGCNTYGSGLDVVIEGHADRVVEEWRLLEVAAAFETKYGPDWHFEVRDSAFHHGGGEAWLFQVAPVTVFGFEKGDPGGQTRWSFERPAG